MANDNPVPQVSRVEADPKRPWKAVAASTLAGVGAFVAFWVADEDPFTWKDAGEAFLAALAAGVPGGLAAFSVRNPLRAKDITWG